MFFFLWQVQGSITINLSHESYMNFEPPGGVGSRGDSILRITRYINYVTTYLHFLVALRFAIHQQRYDLILEF